MKIHMFRRVRLSIIRSLFTVHSAILYVIQVCRQLSSKTSRSCSKAVYKHVWHIPFLSIQWINSWWWTDEMSETCRVSWQNQFVKLVHLAGFITKKFVMMHGHMNVKFDDLFFEIWFLDTVKRNTCHLCVCVLFYRKRNYVYRQVRSQY